MEDTFLVNCGDSTVDCMTIHGMRSLFRCSENKEGLFEVMSNIFMSRELMVFVWPALISSMFLSNIVSGSKFVTSILLFKIIFSNFLSNYSGILEICFSCTMNCGEKMDNFSFRNSVASKRHIVSELIETSSFSICFYYWCYSSLKYINYSCYCLKIWSYISNLAWNLVSKRSSEDEVL